ncbi:MAG: Ig-like domain-containing protein, partial [Gemmatimonadota bacterium]
MPSFLVLSRAASRCALYVPGVLLLVQYGCGDTVSPERSLLSADRVVAVSGGDQSGEVGLALSEPLIIRVLDDRDAGVANVPVSWSIGAGAGTTSSGATATDANGRAQVEWTMGTRAGPNEVSATVSGIPPATFTAVARAGAAARV